MNTTGYYRNGEIRFFLDQPSGPLRIRKFPPFAGFPLVQMVFFRVPDWRKNAIFIEFIRPFTANSHLMLDCYRPIIGLLFPLFLEF